MTPPPLHALAFLMDAKLASILAWARLCVASCWSPWGVGSEGSAINASQQTSKLPRTVSRASRPMKKRACQTGPPELVRGNNGPNAHAWCQAPPPVLTLFKYAGLKGGQRLPRWPAYHLVGTHESACTPWLPLWKGNFSEEMLKAKLPKRPARV